MSAKTVNIIGGGMAGLCAGCYLQMNGYDVTIFEMNNTPGGVCTSWKRGDYTVDLCLHWLVGSGGGSTLHERWNELIDLDDFRFVDHDEFLRVEDAGGNHISVYGNIDRLEKELLHKAPEDEEVIREFIAGLRKLSTFDMRGDEAPEVANVWHRIKSFAQLVPYLPTFGKFMRVTCREYSEHFTHPLLKKVMMYLPDPDMGIIFGMLALTWFHNKTAGYPIGGSLNFATKIFERYVELGGKIRFDARVNEIMVEDGIAVGLQLTNGEKHVADITISAADGHATIFEMLHGKYGDEKLMKFYETARPFPSLLFAAFGVARDLATEPKLLLLNLEKPMVIDPQTTVDHILLYNHSFDPTLAPEGKTLITSMLSTYNYDYWDKLYREDKPKYEREKIRITEEIITVLDKRFGGIRQSIEMTDLSTPVTFSHFSGNWKGSYEGWLLTPETGFKHLPHTLRGLENFYMCGQWVAVGGGLPGVLISARDTAQIICKNDKKEFRVTAPAAALA
jgi:phytoene dehydrogenase-like protein